MKAITGGEKGRQLWPRLVQKVAEGNTTPLQLETSLGTKLLEVGIGRDFGAPKGLRYE